MLLQFPTAFYYFILLLHFTTEHGVGAVRTGLLLLHFTAAFFTTEYRVGAVLERCLERHTQHMLHERLRLLLASHL